MNNNNAIKQSGAYLEIVSFHLGDQEFCIDIMAIREIRGWAPVTPLQFLSVRQIYHQSENIFLNCASPVEA
ncbi:chemotaxis protein CheW, partial [Rhizobium ruizarguesonis]